MAVKKKKKMALDPFKMFLYLSLVAFLTLLLVGYTMFKDSSYEDVDDKLPEFRDFHTDDTEALKEKITKPIIAWWTPFTGNPGSYRTCSDVQCYFTDDRHYLNHPRTKVLLFYGTEFKVKDLPLPRAAHIEWGLMHEESPKNNYLLTKPEVITLFNHTSTFKRESDFPLTLQYLEDIQWLENKQYFQTIKRKNSFKKTESLASVVYTQSDCDAPSDRDNYVKDLMKYIKVDSYGSCLNNKALPQHLQNPLKGMEHEDFYQLMSKYKFTLAMENAICDDYITEKLWRPLMLGSVPIVFGSSKVRDVLPDKEYSAILVDDFKSPKELAEFIMSLDGNDDEYEKYVKWKKEKDGITNKNLTKWLEDRTWNVIDTWQPGRSNFIEDFECFVCERVHENLKLTERGLPGVKYIANKSHLECPAPTLRDQSYWTVDWKYDYDQRDDEAKALRYFVDNHLKLTTGDFHAKVMEIRHKKGEDKGGWF